MWVGVLVCRYFFGQVMSSYHYNCSLIVFSYGGRLVGRQVGG